MALFTKGLLTAGFGTKTWLTIIMGLDAIIYSFITYVYKLFLILARASIIDEGAATQLIRRIYSIIGVVALFMLSYGLLRKMVNPDAKDKDSAGKTIMSIVKAIILLAIVPTLFTYAYKIQTAVLNKNTIGKLILGTNNSFNSNSNYSNPQEMIQNGGVDLAFTVYKAFIFPDDGHEDDKVSGSMNYAETVEAAQKDESFVLFKDMIDDIDSDAIVYYWGISTAAGLYIVYILISYSLSLGFRVVKLAFYEIMAPVCIIASILPSQKEMLSKWVKATLQTFVEVFIRVAVLYFMIYVIALVEKSIQSGTLMNDLSGAGTMLKLLAQAMIIMGLITFMKSAPDLISKLTGIDSSNMSLGIKDQLAKGGLFTAGAIAGGAATSLLRNGVGAISKTKNAFKEAKGMAPGNERQKAFAKAAGSIFTGLGSMAAGTLSGGVHSFNKDAKSFADMKAGASKGAKTAADNKVHRASYKAKHGGTVGGALIGHAKDFGEDVKEFAGIGSVADLEAENKILEGIKAKTSAVKSTAASIVDGEAKKSSSDFAVGDYSAKVLRQKRQDLEAARAAGKSEGESLAAFQERIRNMENDVGTYEYEFGKAVQNAAFLDKESYDKLAPAVRAKISAARVAAEEARAEVVGNLHLEVVQNTGFKADNVKKSWTVDPAIIVKDKDDQVVGTGANAAVKDIGDNIDIRVGENSTKINEHNRKKAEREEGKSDK